MSEHSTPTCGPWRADGATVYAIHRCGLRAGIVADAGSNKFPVCERKANARLIAGAHDLLAALLIAPCAAGDGETVCECMASGQCTDNCPAGKAVRKATMEGGR